MSRFSLRAQNRASPRRNLNPPSALYLAERAEHEFEHRLLAEAITAVAGLADQAGILTPRTDSAIVPMSTISEALAQGRSGRRWVLIADGAV
jgi:hypothetical protein